MPFCPKCKYEYRPGMFDCPDCGSRLVDVLPGEDDSATDGDQPQYEDWVEIGRLTSQQYAEMLVEALKAKDIPAVVHSLTGHFGATGQMGTHLFRPISGAYYALFVPREFVEDADLEAETILGEEWLKCRTV
jgi:hypothetical protein